MTDRLSIYCYTNYRDYLRDAFVRAKQVSAVASYRYFARKAGFKSPNFVQLVIGGKRNLTHDSVPKFAQAFGLKAKERRFFELLVAFNQAQAPTEQHHYYQQMLEFPEFCRAQPLAQEQYEYLTQWYYVVIRELAGLPNFREDPEWIARRLDRRITAAQAKAALEACERLGVLARDANGRLVQQDVQLTTGDAPRSAAAMRYHTQMLERAEEALRTQAPTEREFGALTMPVNARQLALLKNAVRDFRKVVINLLSQPDAAATAVYQLNIQLFGHVLGEKGVRLCGG